MLIQGGVISNGRRLGYAAYTRELLRAGVDEVLVSLHCAEEKLNAHLTGVTGAWEQTVAGIRQLLKTMPDPNQVAVNTTLAAQNLGSLDRLAGLLNDLGIKRWNLQLVTPFGRAHAGLVPREEDLLRHLGALLDQPPPGLRIQLVNCPPCLAPGHEQAAAADQGKAWRNMVFVGAEGENLQLFLSGKRRRTPRCEGCMYALVCPGEYQFRSE